MIFIFSLKEKDYIWQEYVKWVRDIRKKESILHEFKRLFRKNYFSKRYYDSKAKDFYELKMGLITDDEYIDNFLELLSYVLYLMDDKAKV